MWEATDLGSEDLLWATTNFMGGIAGQRDAVCGTVSGAAIYLGLKNRVPLKEKERADKARQKSRELAAGVVIDFRKQYGEITCGKLVEKIVGIDFSDPAAVQKARESGEWMRKCSGFVKYVIEKLYALENQ